LCSNFDLCAKCEALPQPQHDRSHILLKINHPVPNVRQFTPLEYGGEQVLYALEQGQVEQARRSLESFEPLQPTPAATMMMPAANVHPSSANAGVRVERGAVEVNSLEVQTSSEQAHVKVIDVDQEHRGFLGAYLVGQAADAFYG
jgi:hypothetical protein